MEPEGSLPHSQVPATCPYTKPARIQPIPPHFTSWRSILILSPYLRQGLPDGLFSSGFPAKILYTLLLSPIRATCPAHLILLYLITRTILTLALVSQNHFYLLTVGRIAYRHRLTFWQLWTSKTIQICQHDTSTPTRSTFLYISKVFATFPCV